MYDLNMGANLIGSGLKTDTKYAKKVVFYLSQYTGEDFKLAKNLIDTTYNLDGFLALSGAIRGLAVNLSKIANDFRLLDMLGEISLPSFTVILPAKINTASKHAITDKINRIISSPFLSLVKNSFIFFS